MNKFQQHTLKKLSLGYTVPFVLLILLIIAACEQIDKPGYPIVFTGDPTAVNDSTVLLTAQLSNPGNHPVTESGFIWGIYSQDNDGIRVRNSTEPDGIYSLENNFPLLPRRTHYARAYVQSEGSVFYGREVSFEGPDGLVEQGTWTTLIGESVKSDRTIKTVFTLNNNLYIILLWEGLKLYDQVTNTYTSILDDPILNEVVFSVVFDNQAYLFSRKSFYIFSEQSDTLELVTTHPNNLTINPGGFLIDNKVYVGGNPNDSRPRGQEFWEYDIPENQWRQIPDFPLFRSVPCTFVLEGTGYVGGGIITGTRTEMHDLWSYDPAKETWKKRADMPVEAPGGVRGGASVDSLGYAFWNGALHEYNPLYNTWMEMARLWPEHPNFQGYLFVMEESLYAIYISESEEILFTRLWRYEK